MLRNGCWTTIKLKLKHTLPSVQTEMSIPSPPSYYLINHTRKQFAYFDAYTISIFKVLEIALKNYIDWQSSDDVRIDSEVFDSYELIMHLIIDLKYRDLDVDEYESKSE